MWMSLVHVQHEPRSVCVRSSASIVDELQGGVWLVFDISCCRGLPRAHDVRGQAVAALEVSDEAIGRMKLALAA